MIQTSCRFFTGYKPCGRSDICSEKCPQRDIPQTRLLVIHLEALGAVLRSTTLLASIKRKFHSSHVTWVTKRGAVPLLQNNPLIDRILTADGDDLLALRALEFDAVFSLDKSLTAAGILSFVRADLHYGFTVDSRTGAIVPATSAAEELWRIGLDDNVKFFVNQKAETQLACESLELPYARDDYSLFLTDQEARASATLRARWPGPVIGLNTGCSPTIQAKKLTVETHRELCRHLSKLGTVVLLGGGPEDSERNRQIARET
ncbi:MAG: glycosyltransferase family 9 protein, partial [Bdellovibrionia bacterium]